MIVADYVLCSKHMDRHDRPYRCSRPECAQLEGFTYVGGLLRHERNVHSLHGGPKAQMRCTVSTCKRHSGKGFTRKENFIEHLRRVHGITTTDVVTPTEHQDSQGTTYDTPSGGTVDIEREVQDMIEHGVSQQAGRNGHHTAGQYQDQDPTPLSLPHSGPMAQSSQTELTPTIRITTEQPSTPDSQVQLQDSQCTSETSLHAPYSYANPPYLDHNTFYSYASSGSMSMVGGHTQGPPPQVSHMPPVDGIASPISDDTALCRPSLPWNVITTDNTLQHGQKRSCEGAFPGSQEHTATSQCPKRRCESHGLSEPRLKPSVDNRKIGMSTESLSGVQALLQRWFDASAADVLLGPLDG